MTYSTIIARVSAWALTPALLFILPATASAGLLSFMSNLFGPSASAETTEVLATNNSQNMALLEAAHNIDPNPSKGGGDITIVGGSALLPETGPAGTLADVEGHQNNGQISIYVVREGDSLSQIAQMFGVSSNTIIWANDITRGSLITPGQRLVILPISGVRHVVRSGDTLASITKKYKGNFEEILQFNGLGEDATLAVGDVVIIPDGEVAAPAYTPSTTRTARGGGGPTYEGYYLRPVVGGVRTQGIHGYNGVDIAAPYGTPILAAAAGEVIISRSGGWNGGYGAYVVIRHDNGTQTLYAHNSSNIVSIGQKVVQGQVIGYMGSSGRSTGTHVHFEIRGARNPF